MPPLAIPDLVLWSQRAKRWREANPLAEASEISHEDQRRSSVEAKAAFFWAQRSKLPRDYTRSVALAAAVEQLKLQPHSWKFSFWHCVPELWFFAPGLWPVQGGWSVLDSWTPSVSGHPQWRGRGDVRGHSDRRGGVHDDTRLLPGTQCQHRQVRRVAQGRNQGEDQGLLIWRMWPLLLVSTPCHGDPWSLPCWICWRIAHEMWACGSKAWGCRHVQMSVTCGILAPRRWKSTRLETEWVPTWPSSWLWCGRWLLKGRRCSGIKLYKLWCLKGNLHAPVGRCWVWRPRPQTPRGHQSVVWWPLVWLLRCHHHASSVPMRTPMSRSKQWRRWRSRRCSN